MLPAPRRVVMLPLLVLGSGLANPVFLAGSVLFLAGSAAGFVELSRPLQEHQTGIWTDQAIPVQHSET